MFLRGDICDYLLQLVCFLPTDYVTAFCIENNKEHLSPKQINEAITNQVSYARVKLQRRAK